MGEVEFAKRGGCDGGKLEFRRRASLRWVVGSADRSIADTVEEVRRAIFGWQIGGIEESETEPAMTRIRESWEVGKHMCCWINSFTRGSGTSIGWARRLTLTCSNLSYRNSSISGPFAHDIPLGKDIRKLRLRWIGGHQGAALGQQVYDRCRAAHQV